LRERYCLKGLLHYDAGWADSMDNILSWLLQMDDWARRETEGRWRLALEKDCVPARYVVNLCPLDKFGWVLVSLAAREAANPIQ
jgi:hypothetical protein